MKCINKKILSVVMAVSFSLSATACRTDIKEPYSLYSSIEKYGLAPKANSTLLGEQVAHLPQKDSAAASTNEQLAKACGAFNDTTLSTIYSQKADKKIYPASTTKILTAYVALKYGDLNEVYTVSENACNQAADSSVAGLHPGDRITLRDLLKAMLVVSGNDASVAIAEGISGSTEEFAKLMNEEALRLGATHSHFVNPNGLHDDQHYTTVYDMYLIFHAAITEPVFLKIIKARKCNVTYTDASGNVVKKQYIPTNYYKTGEAKAPKGITAIGGKTGTTGKAGYCLVLLSENESGENLISIVYKATDRYSLYTMMNRLLLSFL
ncbi:D-alanyl-D-alanine carboxypeptidase (penicillin-binding protein 5/6) [Lachnospiraceae bacterium KHCPX20]|nr:D-alanyl-D-alanine carboxypeptidase (penicillin-binding protein 5/6) [Lachnospiraceae bacterium KHCPX20]